VTNLPNKDIARRCVSNTVSNTHFHQTTSEGLQANRHILKPLVPWWYATGDGGTRPCWKCWLLSEARPSGNGGSVTATGPRLSAGLRAPDQRPSTGVIGRYFLCCRRAGYGDARSRAPVRTAVVQGATV